MIVIQQSKFIQQSKEHFYLKEVHCSTSTTGCEEFIAGTFFVILLVFLAEIMEKESYHKYFINVLVNILFSCAKLQFISSLVQLKTN